MLARLIFDHRPRGVLVAFDSPHPTLRHKKHAAYKGKRAELPKTLLDQIPVLRSLLSALGVTHISMVGYEADDIIATAATRYSEIGLPVLVVTGDRDLFQIVRDPLIRVLYTRKGVRRQQILDEAGVQSLVGVLPSRYLELASLRGDASDNIAGLPGIGDKTAVKVVNSAASFDALIKGAKRISSHVAQVITSHADLLRSNYELMRLDTNVPLDLDSLNLDVKALSRNVPKEFLTLGVVDLYWTVVRAVEQSFNGSGMTNEVSVRISRRKRICLVSCAADKVSVTAKAKDLYASPLFRKSRAWAEMVGDNWYILSALHGLLDPETLTVPYDKNLDSASASEKKAWADRVARDLLARSNSSELTFILTGQSYAKTLVPILRARGARVSTPLDGMSIGQRLQWLNAQLQVGKAAGDLEEFYEILEWLEHQMEGQRRLDHVDRSPWPERGVYFFFESNERRSCSSRLRVTRVGTHAVSANSKATLWNRLRTHRGVSEGGGNHRSSIFRSHLGAALLHRMGRTADFPHWGNQAADQKVAKPNEDEIERAVSAVIGRMFVTAIDIHDDAGPKSDRAFIERNAIAMLSRIGRILDPPSDKWLGRWSPHPAIHKSGLWNVNYVDEFEYHPSFLEVLDYYARVTAGKAPRVRGSIAPTGWWNRNTSMAQVPFDWREIVESEI